MSLFRRGVPGAGNLFILLLLSCLAIGAANPGSAAAGLMTTLGPAPVDHADAQPAIVNGTAAPASMHPWQVLVQVRTGATTARNCGGAIKEPHLVITAAHCVIDTSTGAPYPPDRFQVVAGLSDLAAPDSSTQFREVAKVEVHPYYDGAAGTGQPDVAALGLASNLFDAGNVRPVPLVDATPRPPVGRVGGISGYGRQAPDRDPDGKLHSIATYVVDPLACGETATAVTVCVSNPRASACEGDSGGPLMFADRLAGIASFVMTDGPTGKCGLGSVNGYVNLGAPEVADWVRGDDTPPRAPRGGTDVGMRGVFEVGQSATCSAGTWSDAPAFSYRFADAAGAVLQAGPSPTYTFTSADTGRSVSCEVEAANAGGTGVTRTAAGPPVAAAPVPPPPPHPLPPAFAPRTKVGVSVRAAREMVRAGGRIGYAIRVRNRGDASAHELAVCARPGRGLAFGRLPKGMRKARGRAAKACWRLDPLRPGARRGLQLTLKASPSRQKTAARSLTVTVSGSNFEARKDVAKVRVARRGRR